MLKTPLEQLAYIVEKAREFDAETAPVDSDSGSNPSDDNDVAILEDTRDNPTRQELVGALDTLNDDQRIKILALMWLLADYLEEAIAALGYSLEDYEKGRL